MLRFLATCGEEEIAQFVYLNLGSFQNLPGRPSTRNTHTLTHTHSHTHTHTHTSCIFFTLGTLLLLLFPDEVNCKAVVPLKRQIGFLNLTRQLLQSLKEKLEPHLSAIMPVLLTMASYCAQLLSTQRDQVSKVDQDSICIYMFCLPIDSCCVCWFTEEYPTAGYKLTKRGNNIIHNILYLL